MTLFPTGIRVLDQAAVAISQKFADKTYAKHVQQIANVLSCKLTDPEKQTPIAIKLVCAVKDDGSVVDKQETPALGICGKTCGSFWPRSQAMPARISNETC